MMHRQPPLHRRSNSTQPQRLCRREPLCHHIQKYGVPTNRLAPPPPPHPLGVKQLPNLKARGQCGGENITQEPQLLPSNMKSLLLFLTGFPLLMAGSPRCINKQLAPACTGGQQQRLWRRAGLQATLELRFRWHTLSPTHTL